MTYEKIAGPLGHRRGDIQAATIAATIANANRGKNSRKAQISDFLIDYDRRGRQQSPDDMLRAITSITKRLGGTVPE